MNRSKDSSAAPLSTHDLKLAYGTSVIVPQLNLSLKGGEVTSIIGPNGCGKSTLLRALARLRPVSGGNVQLYGQALHSLPSKEVARRLAILPQGPDRAGGPVGGGTGLVWPPPAPGPLPAAPPRGPRGGGLGAGADRYDHFRQSPAGSALGWAAPARLDRHEPGPANRDSAAGRTHHLPRSVAPARSPATGPAPQPRSRARRW